MKLTNFVAEVLSGVPDARIVHLGFAGHPSLAMVFRLGQDASELAHAFRECADSLERGNTPKPTKEVQAGEK